MRSRNWNVIYASLGNYGEEEIGAMVKNRTRKKTKLRRGGPLSGEIESRTCFGDRWVGGGDIKVVKMYAKARLERKTKLDWAREKSFKEDMRRYGRMKSWLAGRIVRFSDHNY